MSDIIKAWVRVCALEDVPADKARDVNINGQRLVIARCGSDAHILQGFCSHMLYPLGGSTLDGCTLTCNLHNSAFDIRDGSVLKWTPRLPLSEQVLDDIRERKSLHTFETRVTDGDVFVLWTTDNPDSVRIRI
jgi:3-phenylpropionate/trans-cinnamate dioxygenase ferredoxin component